MSKKKLKLLNDKKSDFKEIFNFYYQPLLNLGIHYLGNEDEAKGVVQDAFIKLWEIKHDLNKKTNLKNFLFTLVKNNCLNIIKHKQIMLKHHEKIKWIELNYQYESLSRIEDNYLEYDELKDKIEAAIQNLPAQCRKVFELSRHEELKNREIADKLGISQKTVEAHLTKAIKILREDLKEYLPFSILLLRLFN